LKRPACSRISYNDTAVVGIPPRMQYRARKGKRRNYAGSENHSIIIWENHVIYFRVPLNSFTTKEMKKIKGDQEGGRLDMKPDPGGS